MPTSVLQAAVGAGKTEAGLQRLVSLVDPQSTSDASPDIFPKAWVLLATKRQEIAFRQRLIEYSKDHSVLFNIEFFNFYELNTRILNITHVPHRRIHEPARLGLIRTIAENLYEQGALDVFKTIWYTQGFVSIVANFIYELKQNLVESNTFAEMAQTQKDRELALIYTRYQDVLIEKDLVDREGEGWLAEIATRNPDNEFSKIRLLLVDGYDQFNLVQARVLANLSRHIPEVLVTLTTVPERKENIGRRFEKAFRVLQDAHKTVGASFRIADMYQHVDTRNADLQHLTQTIFLPDVVEQAMETEAIQFLEAPEPTQEVSAVLRRIKRMLMLGVRPDDILIAVRDWSLYGTPLNAYRRLYHIPLMIHYTASIADNPALAVLLNVLTLANGAERGRGFHRREVLDVLRSPYITVPFLTPADVERLDEISTQGLVVAGRDQWLQAIRYATQSTNTREDDREGIQLSVEDATRLEQALATFFDHVTPPPMAFLTEYIQWIEALIGTDVLTEPSDANEAIYPNLPEDDVKLPPYSLQMVRAIRAVSDDTDDLTKRVLARDISAINSLKMILRGFLHIEELMKSTLHEQPEPTTWESFFAELRITIQNAGEKGQNAVRNGRVLATTAAEARGLPHAHVFVLGLSEGVFPAPISEDPLYLDTERQAFNQRGVLLETQGERANDDGIFYELISLPFETLTLSRPTVREGKFWNESHLWRMARAVFKKQDLAMRTQTIKIGDLVDFGEVASLDEAVLATAQALSDKNEQGIPLLDWLYADSDRLQLWHRVLHGRALESRRQSKGEIDDYSGMITHETQQNMLAQHLDESYRWSASQFNEFGKCGYYFFAHRLLGLEELEEPQEGLDNRQFGTLVHALLEQTYQPFMEQGLRISPENSALALEQFKQVFETVMPNAPKLFNFRANALWELEQVVIERQLRQLIAQDFSAQAPFNDIVQGERVIWRLETYFKAKMTLDSVGTLAVGGFIDRIDRVGNQLIVVDYKTGSDIPLKEMAEGRNYQMMVYLLGLAETAQEHNLRVAGGFFWHTRKPHASGIFNFSNEEHQQALEQAQALLGQHIQNSRDGLFPIKAKKPDSPSRCTSYCPYFQICRLGTTYPKDLPHAHAE